MADTSYTITGSEDAVQAARIAAGCHMRGWVHLMTPRGLTLIWPWGDASWTVTGDTPGEAYARAHEAARKSGDSEDREQDHTPTNGG